MFSGKAEKHLPSGGNVERENFNKKVSGMKGGEKKTPASDPPEGPGGNKTEIQHNPDGSHSVKHADGESSEHPNMAHLAMHMHAKHADGEAGHVHAKDDGTATTHHVGMDGIVEGPHEHGSAGEATDHLAQMLGGGGHDAMADPMGPQEIGGSAGPKLY